MPIDVKTTDIESLSQFVKEVENYLPSANRGNFPLVFRGVPDLAYELIPAVGRDLWSGRHRYGGRSPVREKLVLDMFSTRCVGYLTQRPANLLEVMIHARHHGLPTRLLDWTFSPLVALYFALNDAKKDVDVAVYAGMPPVNLQQSPKRDEIEKSPLNPDQDYFITPPWVSPRIIAQQGCFTLHADVKKPIKLSQMRRYRIESSKVTKIRFQLHYAGVTAQTIFPDLDGLAASITFDIFGPMDLSSRPPDPV